jgi:peptidase MA superfamily protein
MRRLTRAASAAWLAVLLATAPAVAIEVPPLRGPSFGTPAASSSFLSGITFVQPVALFAEGTVVEVVIEQQGSSTSFVSIVPVAAASANFELTYELELPSGAAVPGTTFTARWRLTPPGGEPVLGPTVTAAYLDDRFDWQTARGEIVRMHWYDGSAQFGRQALDIAEAGVEDAAALLGVDEREPIDFFLYADVEPFYDALGPASRENVGGVAYPEVRTMLAQIEPGAINASWIRTVIPHELMHIVFANAVENPYHFPPKWLNEGLAVFQSEGYRSDRQGDVEAAVSDSRLLPLSALVGQFPTSFDQFVLAYAESVSAVDYLVRTYGRDELVGLIRSYADGVSDDAAFTAALGVDVEGFQAGWLADLGASAPEAFGPQPAPPGPLPPGWEVAPTPAPSGAAASPTPAATSEPAPNGSERGCPVPAVIAITALVVFLGGAVLLWRRQQARPPTEPSAEGPADNGGPS